MFSSKQLWIFGLLLIALLVLTYVFFSRIVEAPTPAADQGANEEEVLEEETAQAGLITHVIDGREHTVSGTIPLPTPCHELITNVSVSSTTPSEALVTLESRDIGGMCIQVIDDREFSLTFEADREAVVRVLYNGVSQTLTEPTE